MGPLSCAVAGLQCWPCVPHQASRDCHCFCAARLQLAKEKGEAFVRTPWARLQDGSAGEEARLEQTAAAFAGNLTLPIPAPHPAWVL